MTTTPTTSTIATIRDVLLLALFTGIITTTGLTDHGVTNWQEAQRLVVAREMQAAGDWLVPTINGAPYLAKPPLIYWCQLALASVTSQTVNLAHLRLTVAIFGVLGVVATYLVTRALLAPPTHRPSAGSDPSAARNAARERHDARTAAIVAALTLATGVLYVRSARIGEIDILLTPFVVVAIGAIALAYKRFVAGHRRQQLGLVSLAAVATVGASLAKGPPAVLSIALAAYVGVALHIAANATRSRVANVPRRFGPVVAPVVGAIGLPVASASLHGFANLPGLLAFTLLGAGAGWTVGALASRAAARAMWDAFSRTHPVGVVGAGLGAVWLWGRLVAGATDVQAAREFAADELRENLLVLVPEAPINNLEALAFGVGLGSVLAIGALVWIVKDRPALRTHHWIILAWVLANLAAFSVLGKGVQRYLTPVWPGVAMLAGVFSAQWMRDQSAPTGKHAAKLVFGASIAALALAQTVWYARGREHFSAQRSPRALVRELVHEHKADPARLVSVGFYTPAIDAYTLHLCAPVHRVNADDPNARPGVGLDVRTMGVEPIDLAQLSERVAQSPVVALVRRSEASLLADRLMALGVRAAVIDSGASFVIDSGRSTVAALRLTIVPDAQPARSNEPSVSRAPTPSVQDAPSPSRSAPSAR